MNGRALASALVLAALVVSPEGRSAGPQSDTELRLAVLPCTNIETTFRKFHPLLAHLKARTGYAVTLVLPVELTRLETDTLHGRIDFALQDPHTFQQVSHLFDTTALLQTRSLDGTLGQSAVVIVRRDSGVAAPEQLRGRTVMFGPQTSSSKWVAARQLFEARGLAVDRDLKVTNGGCCEDIAFAVIVRSVDAGVICDHFLDQHGARQRELGVDPAVLSVIGRTAAYPTRVFAARKGLPAKVVTAITEALLEIDATRPPGAAMLESIEARGFVRTTEAEYLKSLAAPPPPARP